MLQSHYQTDTQRTARNQDDLISSYQFINDNRLDEDRESKSCFSPVNKDTLVNHYMGFKGIKDQIADLKKEYEVDKMQVSSDIITKAKGLKFLKKV